MSDAEDARFRAFMESTDANERDWIAFCEFEEAIHNGVTSACMINMYDGGQEGVREMDSLKLSLGQMLFRVLPRVDLGVLIANVEGIGCAGRDLRSYEGPQQRDLEGVRPIQESSSERRGEVLG